MLSSSCVVHRGRSSLKTGRCREGWRRIRALASHFFATPRTTRLNELSSKPAVFHLSFHFAVTLPHGAKSRARCPLLSVPPRRPPPKPPLPRPAYSYAAFPPPSPRLLFAHTSPPRPPPQMLGFSLNVASGTLVTAPRGRRSGRCATSTRASSAARGFSWRLPGR